MNRELFELEERDEFRFDAEKFSAFRAATQSPHDPKYSVMVQDIDVLKRKEKKRKIKKVAAIIIGFMSAVVCRLVKNKGK